MATELTQIRPAHQSETESIFSIYTACRRALEAEGIHQWYEGYPTRTIIAADAEKGHLHCMSTESSPLAAICLNEEQEAAYRSIPWQFEVSKICVIHRLAVHPDFQHQGIARRLMNFAEETARMEGARAVRLDAYSGNGRVLRFYENCGYQQRGQVFFPGRNLPFICYEKLLRP